MNVFAKFDKIPSMILEVIKETKRYGHTFGRTVVRSFGRSDNVKTVYPPTNTVCGGYNNANMLMLLIQISQVDFPILINWMRPLSFLGAELTCIPDLGLNTDIEGQVLGPRSLVCVSMCECVPPCMLN